MGTADSDQRTAVRATPTPLHTDLLPQHNGARAPLPSAIERHTVNDDDENNNKDATVPSLVARPSQGLSDSRQDRLAASLSEDEVNASVSPAPQSLKASLDAARTSSEPVHVAADPHERTSQRAASAQPERPNEQGNATNPIQFGSSDASLELMKDDGYDSASVSDVSDVSYDEDSEEYEKGEYFYTSSEGSLHGSDSEEGLGSWTKDDKEKWQGSTAHLDEAYDGNFDVRAVLRHRKNPRRGFTEYRTVWAGYPIYSTTWEPESHFNSARTLREYWERQGGRPADEPIDMNEYSTHDSDTDVAVIRRPRKRAHEAKQKKRREIRRDKVQLRRYLLSLDQKRRSAKVKEEKRYERFRLANRLQLDTERVHERGTSRSYQKRLEKLQQKRWRRAGGAGTDSGGPSRFSSMHANRNLADVSMRARAGAGSSTTSARTRVSQLDDSIPENDENQMVFRRSTGTSGPNFPGLSSSMAPIRPRSDYSSGSARPTVPLSSGTGGAGTSGSGSATQGPPQRPVPGSYKGAHRREPKVQIRNDAFGGFLDRLHANAGGARDKTADVVPTHALPTPTPTPTTSDGRPITAQRRPSEGRKPNLLVLKPVEDFKGGSRAAVPPATVAAAAVHSASSVSSDAGDSDTFGIPEMSAVRSRFNPHQPIPADEDEALRARRVQPSGATSAADKTRAGDSLALGGGKSQKVSGRARVEDPRRRLRFAAQDIDMQPGWSPPVDEGHWSPQEAGSTAQDARMLTTSRSPSEGTSHTKRNDGAQARAPQRVVWNGWLEFIAGHNRIDMEGALYALESLSADRLTALGLSDDLNGLRFDLFMPFAWIRDILAAQGSNADEAMILNAYGRHAPHDRSSLDQLSEQLKDFDIALLARAGGDSTADGLRQQYFVVFSSKYDVDYITGVPPSLRHVCGQPWTLCVVPLLLEHHPAAAEQISFEHPPSLDPSVANIFDAACGKKTIEDLKVGRNEIRKVKRAAQRYRITPQLYEWIRSRYNVIFLGRNPPSYEKSVLYYIVRIFEGGARLQLDPEKDARLYKDPKIGVNVFVRRAALAEILDPEQPTLALAGYLRRFKRQQRCTFWTFGFSPEDPSEHIREIFPGRDGLVTFSLSAILADLLRSSMEEKDGHEVEEGQLSQNEKKAPSILCNTAYHLADNWRVRLHPWIRSCFKLLADQLEPACRALRLIEEDQEFPIELMLELDSKLEALYTSALVEQWPVDVINGAPVDEPTELVEEPEELVRRMDNEILATLSKAQLHTAGDTRFHVMVTCSEGEEEMSEEKRAGVEVISLKELGEDKCKELAKLPGN